MSIRGENYPHLYESLKHPYGLNLKFSGKFLTGEIDMFAPKEDRGFIWGFLKVFFISPRCIKLKENSWCVLKALLDS